MKRPGICTAGAVGALALAAVSMQLGSPHADEHETASVTTVPTVTVQRWAGGTYTPAGRSAHDSSAHDSSAHVASLQRSAPRALGARVASAPTRAAQNIAVESGMRAVAPRARTGVQQLPTTSAATAPNQRGA